MRRKPILLKIMISAHNIDTGYRLISTFFSSILANFKARWLGINLNGSIKVKGKIHFRRLPGSIVIIGNKCRFNSKTNSNLIGINRPCMISTLDRKAVIKIGDNCGFSGTVIGAFINIEIGNNVMIGANSLITDGDWHLTDDRTSPPKPVKISDNVWIGEDVKILKGVTVGRNSVIGAGSIVTKSIPENVIAAGNPCKIIRTI